MPTTNTTPTLGFIGLGRMGEKMCRNLVRKSGATVLVYDVRESAVAAQVAEGAEAAAGVADLAARSDVIFTSLPMPEDVRAVALGPGGILENAKPGTAYFDFTTNSVDTARTVSEALATRGIVMMDAPVSGSVDRAEDGSLVIMIGGDRATFDLHLSTLQTMGSSTRHTGGFGTGLVAKLVNNMLALVSVSAAAEGLMLGAAAGIDPVVLDSIIRESTADSRMYRILADRALSGRYDSPTFTLDLAYKDAHLFLELADRLSVPSPIASGTHNVMRLAKGAGLGDADFTAVMKFYEDVLKRKIGADS